MSTDAAPRVIDPLAELLARDFPDMPVAEFIRKLAEYRDAGRRSLAALEGCGCGCGGSHTGG